MIPGFNIEPWKLIDRRFRVKKVHYNKYEVDHNVVQGELRLLNVPTNILEIPKDMLPPGLANPDFPSFMIGTQVIVAFTSKLPRKEIKVRTITTGAVKKKEITSFIIDAPYEPWNEFVLQGSPPLLVRIRTILTKLEWLEEYTDPIGGPALQVNHNVTHDVSIASTPEAGLT